VPQKAQFSPYEFDLLTGDLTQHGMRVRLETQPAKVLELLIQAKGDLVSRRELIAELWPGEVEGNFDRRLDKAIAKLRASLNDNPSMPRFIETIPKRGYRFVAPISEAAGRSDPVADSNHASAPVLSDDTSEPKQSIPAHGPLPVLHQHRGVLAALIALTLVALIGYAVLLRAHRSSSSAHDARKDESDFKIVPITSAPGDADSPVFSPDEREIAYLWNGAERTRVDVYVLMLGAETPLRLTFNKAASIGPPAWSPDGREVAFSRCDGHNNGVFVVPALGGEERKLTSIGCLLTQASRLAWLPDGKGMLMVDRCSSTGPFGVVLFSFATGDKSCLTNSGSLHGVDVGLDYALSPTGKTIAFTPATSGMHCEIYTVPVAGGTPQRLTTDAQCWGELMWTSDSQAIVFSSSRTTLFTFCRVPANGGPIEREVRYQQVGSLSKDGRRIVYSELTSAEGPEIWRADMAAAGGAVLKNRLLIASQKEEKDAQPSPDGARIVWMSWRTGFAEIWTSMATGEHPMQLTRLGGYSGTPRWSPDGKSIAFDSLTKNGTQIFVVDSEGKNLHSITNGPFDNAVPSWARNGRSIYFSSNRTGRWEAWKHSLTDGRELQITSHGGFDPFESQDGRTIYFSRFDQAGIWKVSASGGAESLVIADKPQIGYWGHWAVTQAGIYLLNADAEPKPRIEFYDFATRRASSVFSVDKNLARLQPSLSATADGRTVYYTQYDEQRMIKMRESSP
jgi:Tol biopolymer transport system component/DNA-binding winged helix-turn-helix (wHTH) protein